MNHGQRIRRCSCRRYNWHQNDDECWIDAVNRSFGNILAELSHHVLRQGRVQMTEDHPYIQCNETYCQETPKGFRCQCLAKDFHRRTFRRLKLADRAAFRLQFEPAKCIIKTRVAAASSMSRWIERSRGKCRRCLRIDLDLPHGCGDDASDDVGDDATEDDCSIGR